MYPTAAVSGWYFSHPEARYFQVGQIDADQVADYARRKGMTSRRGRALARAADRLRPGGGCRLIGDFAAGTYARADSREPGATPRAP